MSETVTYVGKIKKIDLGDLTKEEWCKQTYIGKGGDKNAVGTKDSYYETWKEALGCDYGDEYFFHNEEIWEAVESKEISYNDISVLTPNPDGTYSFIMQFYNGGTCLSEMIEDELKRQNKNNDE